MDERTAKGLDFKMPVSAIRSQVNRKLYRLAGPAYSGVLALVESPRDAEAETGDQRPADAEVEG